MKRCSRCKEFKPTAEYNKQSGSKDGYHAYCRVCYNAYMRERTTIEDTRIRNLKRLYGITPHQYQEMFIAQHGLCAVCGRPETETDKRTGQIKNLHVDHCHTTGRIRALLCGECNSALGYLHDDPQRIKRLLAYAEHQQALTEVNHE